LRIKDRPKNIPLIQAVAAVGQVQLMKVYEKIFAEVDLLPAQVLLTKDDFTDRTRYTNAMNTISSLLKLKVVPVINENDTVAVDEIKLGDNDNLSAQVTNLAQADFLIILTDVAGLYTENPRKNKKAKLVRRIEKIDDRIKKMATRSFSTTGQGGMITKLQAAEIVTTSGIGMIIAGGEEENILLRLLAGEEIGTLFLPRQDKMASFKRWIAFTLPSRGEIVVDEGAEEAIKNNGCSLLPGGILEVKGDFKVGDKVKIITSQNQTLGCGLVNYSSEEIKKIKGQKTKQINKILGYKYFDEVIHRDSLVILD
jgi:glutamate 5-kinase